MIWRIWSILMVVLVGGVWLLAIPYSPQPILETGTVINLYRDMGMVPEAGEITFSQEIGHDVFEVPERDEEELKMVMASMNMEGMSGMEGMAGMDMNKDDDHAGDEMQGMASMDMNKEDDHAAEEMKPMAGMEMEQDADNAGNEMQGMAAMDMSKEDDHAAEEMKPMAGMEMEQDADHSGEEMQGMAAMDMNKEDDHAAEEMKPMDQPIFTASYLHHGLIAPIIERQHHDSTWLKLRHQRLGHLGAGRSHDDAIKVITQIGPAGSAVGVSQLHIVKFQLGKALAGLQVERLDALDAINLWENTGQDSGLVTTAGTNFKHRVRYSILLQQ